MVGMIMVNGHCTVQLFNQHHPNHGMGECELRERPMPCSSFTYCFRMTIWPANRQYHIIAFQHPAFHGFSQFFCTELTFTLFLCVQDFTLLQCLLITVSYNI